MFIPVCHHPSLLTPRRASPAAEEKTNNEQVPEVALAYRNEEGGSRETVESLIQRVVSSDVDSESRLRYLAQLLNAHGAGSGDRAQERNHGARDAIVEDPRGSSPPQSHDLLSIERPHQQREERGLGSRQNDRPVAATVSSDEEENATANVVTPLGSSIESPITSKAAFSTNPFIISDKKLRSQNEERIREIIKRAKSQGVEERDLLASHNTTKIKDPSEGSSIEDPSTGNDPAVSSISSDVGDRRDQIFERAVGLGSEVTEGAPGATCHQCQGQIKEGSACVEARKGCPGVVWHKECFQCEECGNVLPKLVYFALGGQVYCLVDFLKAAGLDDSDGGLADCSKKCSNCGQLAQDYMIMKKAVVCLDCLKNYKPVVDFAANMDQGATMNEKDIACAEAVASFSAQISNQPGGSLLSTAQSLMAQDQQVARHSFVTSEGSRMTFLQTDSLQSLAQYDFLQRCDGIVAGDPQRPRPQPRTRPVVPPRMSRHADPLFHFVSNNVTHVHSAGDDIEKMVQDLCFESKPFTVRKSGYIYLLYDMATLSFTSNLPELT